MYDFANNKIIKTYYGTNVTNSLSLLLSSGEYEFRHIGNFISEKGYEAAGLNNMQFNCVEFILNHETKTLDVNENHLHNPVGFKNTLTHTIVPHPDMPDDYSVVTYNLFARVVVPDKKYYYLGLSSNYDNRYLFNVFWEHNSYGRIDFEIISGNFEKSLFNFWEFG